MCSQHNRAATFGRAGFDQEPTIDALYNEVAMRIASPEPIRVCDDAATWDWRKYVARRSP